MALFRNLKRLHKLVQVTQKNLSTSPMCASLNCTQTLSPTPQALTKREYSDENKIANCKVAIVTGGARGIGYHIADYLLKAGAKAVIIGDVLVDECEEATIKLNEKHGENKALFQPCDVTKKQDLEKIFKCTKDRFGKIDIVVNNAGVAESDYEKIVNINVTGLVLGTLLGFEHMGSHCGGNGGYIINVASILGLQPLYSMPVYCGTKWFVIGFTKSMGSDYFCKMTNVKVMAVCPGVTHTEIIKNAGKATLRGFDQLDKEAANSLGSLPAQGSTTPKLVTSSIPSGLQYNEIYNTVIFDNSLLKSLPPYWNYKVLKLTKGGKQNQDCPQDKCKKKPKIPTDKCEKKDPCKKEKCKHEKNDCH